MATFKKNDRVALIADWDRKGTVYIRRATVHSSGAKVTRLIDQNGEMFKVALDTAHVPLYADATDAELEAIDLERAEAILASERECLNRRLTMEFGEGYYNAILKSLNALHEPRAMWR